MELVLCGVPQGCPQVLTGAGFSSGGSAGVESISTLSWVLGQIQFLWLSHLGPRLLLADLEATCSSLPRGFSQHGH